jgi:hypothetical protein
VDDLTRRIYQAKELLPGPGLEGFDVSIFVFVNSFFAIIANETAKIF